MNQSSGEEPNFDEIRGLIASLPGPDPDSAKAAAGVAAELRSQGEELGRLAELVEWLAAWQGRARPALERPRIAVFAASHGIAARDGASAGRATQDWVEATVAGKTALNRVATGLDADLRIYELALEQPSGDFATGAALSEADCARAMAYGMMTVEEGFDVMVLGAMGAGNETAARALAAALFGGGAEAWSSSEDREVIAAGLERHGAAAADPLYALRAFGGLEMAAVAGAILACRLARQPVVLDGLAALAAGAALHSLGDGLLAHCRAASGGGGGSEDRLLAALQLASLNSLATSAGSGIAGAAGLPLLRAAASALSV